MKLRFDKTILKQKIGKVPVPVVVVGGGVLAVLAYRRWGGGGAGGSGSAAGLSDTGDTGGPTDYSGGSAGGGQVASGGGDPIDFSGYSAGAFVPAATMGTAQQPIIQRARWVPTWRPTWKPTWKPPHPQRPRRRPLIVNRIVINNKAFPQRPTVVNKGFAGGPKFGVSSGPKFGVVAQRNRRRRVGESPPKLRHPAGR